MLEKSSLMHSKNSNFNYFIFNDYEDFGNDSYYYFFPIKNKNPLGTILLKILNSKSKLYDSFSSFMNSIKTINSLDELNTKIIEFYESNWKEDFLTPIPNKLNSELYKSNSIEDLHEIFQNYFSNIKSIIENFCDHCIEPDSELKQYINWNMKIPESYFMFGTEDSEDHCIYLQRPIEFNRFKEENRIDKLIPVKKYVITDFIDLLNVNIDICFLNKIHINKCKNCSKYFIPSNRSDEKYCDNPSPQKANKTCKQYGVKKAYITSIASNPIKEEHTRTSQFFRVKIFRAKQKNDIALISNLNNTLQKYLTNYQKQLKKYEKNKLSESEFTEWIIAQKNI